MGATGERIRIWLWREMVLGRFISVRVVRDMAESDDFEEFVIDVERRLRRALVGAVGVNQVDDAVAEALAYLAEHRDRVLFMENPVGYLYRVAQTRTKPAKTPALPVVHPASIPDVEPGLAPALMALPEAQRTAVWLAHGCGWRSTDIADALEISASTVATHISRGLASLRAELGVRNDHA